MTVRTHLRILVLEQWIEAGLALARAATCDPGRGLVQGVRVLSRVWRAVRLAVVLVLRLSDPSDPTFQPARVRTRTPAPAQARTQDAPDPPGQPARAPLHRPRPLDVLRGDTALLRRPLAEIVETICKALGVAPDWSLWSDEDEGPAAPDPVMAFRMCKAPPRLDRGFRRPPPRRLLPGLPSGPLRAARPRLARLRTSCAPSALQSVLAPIVALASGGFRLA